ncbi:MAG: phosphoribosylformylglycinamidine cyclo-ligase [Bacillota bacterium]
MSGEWTYRDSGVDIDAGNRAVELIKPHAERTGRPGLVGSIGGFGGLFSPPRLKHPLLVSGTDGVGTKLKIAFLMDKHDTVGLDCVAYCVNDIIVQGAEPLFFLDYIGCGQLIPEQVESIVKGVADGCVAAGCALVGGETAELPGMYKPGEYDLVGFAVGAVEQDRLIDGSKVRPGDALIGLASTGLHSSGYSLARKILLEAGGLKVEDELPELGRTLGAELLEPTAIYVKPLLALLETTPVHAIANITGGGFYDNIPRVLPPGCRAKVEERAWQPQPIFQLIARMGNVSKREMFRTFNMGVGMVLAVPPSSAGDACRSLQGLGVEAFPIGHIAAGEAGVDIQ